MSRVLRYDKCPIFSTLAWPSLLGGGQFRLLSPIVQLFWVMQHGTFLAQRWEEEEGVNRYYYVDEGRSFLVEVRVDDGQEQPIVLRSFVRSVPLEDYSH